jgi:hypothetical protein
MGIKPVEDGTEFTGNVKIGGTLDLPNGIINNAALADPITTGVAGFTQFNLSFGTSPTQYGTQTITVPEGFTQAVVFNGVSAGGTNSGADVDFIYVASGINGVGGGETPTRAGAGQYGSASAFGIRTLTDLVGGSNITVSVQVRTNTAAWSASPANIANINAIAIFYR